MSARKLQQEMDRVFKRVGEGVTLFDSIYEKLQQSTNQSQKEKLEQDLKRELKKLQKLRDQIKTWIGGNEVRDKKQLLEQRRLIETEMERFKVVEREIKTKAYSREGLSSNKSDPHEKEKRETTEFLQTQIDQLEQQTETLEAEQETLQGSMKKGKKDNDKQERIGEIEHLLERHKWHMEKMEIMMRMIDNDTLAPESVDELQDDILYYVESNQELDFAEDEAIYDDLNLIEEGDDEEIVETIVRDDTYSLEDLAQDLSKEAAKEAALREKEKEREEREKVKEKEKEKDRERTASKSASPVPASHAHKGKSQSPSFEKRIPPGLSPLPPPRTGTPAAEVPSTKQAPTPEREQMPAAAAVSTGPAPASVARQPSKPAVPEELQDLAASFDKAKQRLTEGKQFSAIAAMLEASFMNTPDAVLADQPRYYHPESPFPTPDCYPSEALLSLDDPAIFAKMDVDTLFYIFYYRQGTFQQYLAAKELKSRSWRFHKRFLTWFQRHEEPTVINTEFEQGTYRFFDFEGSWLQRRKSNFKFEYKYLEDEV